MTSCLTAFMWALFFVCPPEIENISLAKATAYNWELGGINTDHDPTQTAIGLPTKRVYFGRIAACPLAMIGRQNTAVISFPEWTHLEDRYCADTFGTPKLQRPRLTEGGNVHAGEYVWYIHVDFAEALPHDFRFNTLFIDGISWRWESTTPLFRLPTN